MATRQFHWDEMCVEKEDIGTMLRQMRIIGIDCERVSGVVPHPMCGLRR